MLSLLVSHLFLYHFLGSYCPCPVACDYIKYTFLPFSKCGICFFNPPLQPERKVVGPCNLAWRLTIKGGQKSPFFMDTIYCYYILFKDNFGIIFPKFEVPSINDVLHWGKWSLANPFKMAKFQSEKSTILTPNLSRSWKNTIWKCFFF